MTVLWILLVTTVITSSLYPGTNCEQVDVSENDIPIYRELHQIPISTTNETIIHLRNLMHEQILSILKSDCSWDFGNTAKAVIALSLANEAFFQSNIMSNLIQKQLHLEILLILARKHERDELPQKLIHYINALISMCEDPHNFHNFNLIKKIKHVQLVSNYEEALRMLTLCNANEKLSKRNILRLTEILENNSTDTDTLAITAMAFVCNRRFLHNIYNIPNLYRPIEKIKAQQKADGSFGNVYTTALVLQTLIAVGDFNGNWDFSQAINYIKSKYEDNKFHSNVMAYYYVLPVLNFKSMAHLSAVNCDVNKKHMCKEKMLTNLNYQQQNDAITMNSVTYSLKCDCTEFKNASISTVVILEKGKTLLDVMKYAAHADERFIYSLTNSSFGLFVHSIGDLENNVNNNKFWMIYFWDSSSDRYIAADAGVTEIIPEDNDHYVAWYKQF